MTILYEIINGSNIGMFTFIAGIVLLGASILFLRSALFFVIQAIVMLALVFMGTSAVMGVVIGIFQAILVLYFLYRIKRAIDYNYQLVLEKTHTIPPKITRGGNSGIRTAF